MATIFDLTDDLVGQILARVPLTSLSAVRRTCKNWNALSKYQIFGKLARKQFLGFMMTECRVFSMRFDLQGIRNNDDFVVPSIKQVDILNHVEISQVFHCDGLLLCVIKNQPSLVVWNPYLGQTNWIQPRNNSFKKFSRFDQYALGYDNKNRNHKILRILFDYDCEVGRKRISEYEIYDFSSNSWRMLNLKSDWNVYKRGVSLKGNTYFFAQAKITKDTNIPDIQDILLCFDFTTERFGPRLPLPFHSYFGETVTISSVKEEQLSMLYQHDEILEIWITTKIDPNAVSWSKFLKVDITPLNGFPNKFEASSFFLDEEMKVVVVSDVDRIERTETSAYIIGQDGYFKSVRIGDARNLEKVEEWGFTIYPPKFSSYVPSLVQLQIQQQRKRK